ncbi:hypothetical protein [Mycobacterium sp.]|uniref:hypothetical protein n=1 Tax=Mycobacterium sp. TaxID=1785 RepID=UPI0031CE691A
MRGHCRRLVCALSAAMVLAACGKAADSSGPPARATPAAPAGSSLPAVPAAPATSRPRPEKWIDLQAGDCLSELPSTDPSVVSVTVVDCAAAHQAEVYLRAPLAVNAAVAGIANQQCAEGFSRYTGRPVDGSPYALTYLIDSNQDRTADNPAPSTVICLLHATNGQPLTGSALR